jgi:hypothetical protein
MVPPTLTAMAGVNSEAERPSDGKLTSIATATVATI